MQNRAIDEAGNVWELDTQGNPVAMVEAAAQQGRVFSLPQNPKEVRQEARQDRQDTRADRREDRAEDTAARQAQNDALGNQIKQLELQIKREELNKGDKDTKEGNDRIGRLNALTRQITRVRELYDAGPGATKGLSGLQDYAPTNENAQFDAAGASLSAQGLAAFRVPGSGTVSDRDAIMFDRANLPTAATRDLAIEEQLRGLQSRVEEEYRTLGQPLPNWEDAANGKAQQRADNEVPDATTGAALKPQVDDDTPPQNRGRLALPTDGNRLVRDPRLASQMDAMINAGAGENTINAMLRKQNFPPVSARDLRDARQWMKDNPGKKYYGSDPTRPEELSMGQKIMANPAVAPVAAGLAHYTDAATAGLVGTLAGQDARGNLDAAAALNPGASMVGTLAGGVTGALGAEAAVAARAPVALAQYAPRIADALYGGALGFNNARDGEGAAGALYGAGAGLVGGVLGQGMASGLGRGLRGVQDANVGYLRGQGVPLTVGQTLANSGRVGATVKNVEDALTSVPGVSSIVNARRTEGLEGFNQAAMRQAGAPAGIPVNASGSQGMEQLQAGIGPAYDAALGGAQIDANDPGFAASFQDLVNATNARRMGGDARTAAVEAIDNRFMDATDPASGIISGRGFQEAYRGLGRTARERAAGDYGHEVGQVMREGQNTLAGALDAQNPGALEAFRNANAVNRNANVIAQALDKAKNQGDELFTPAQINMADAASTKRLEGPMASAAGDRPFFDLARAGQEVLPSRLPDSGTATRGLVGAGVVGGLGGMGVGSALGDASSGAQTGLGLTLLLAAGGSRPAQAAMVRLLADRPDALQRIGTRVFDNALYGGTAGAGALSGYVSGQ